VPLGLALHTKQVRSEPFSNLIGMGEVVCQDGGNLGHNARLSRFGSVVASLAGAVCVPRKPRRSAGGGRHVELRPATGASPLQVTPVLTRGRIARRVQHVVRCLLRGPWRCMA
jgi:hypothetical protein